MVATIIILKKSIKNIAGVDVEKAILDYQITKNKK